MDDIHPVWEKKETKNTKKIEENIIKSIRNLFKMKQLTIE